MLDVWAQAATVNTMLTMKTRANVRVSSWRRSVRLVTVGSGCMGFDFKSRQLTGSVGKILNDIKYVAAYLLHTRAKVNLYAQFRV